MKYITAYIYIILGLLSIETGCAHDRKAHASAPAATGYGPAHILSSSVAIKCGNHGGSGVLVRKDNTLFVWTAAHVVTDVADSPVLVYQDVVSEGKIVDQTYCSVDLVYVDEATDIALFFLAHPPTEWSGVSFEEGIRPTGTPVVHVGNFFGTFTGSYSTGVISAVGRMKDLGEGGVGPMDQISCEVFPGSSGGGVFYYDDSCVGIVSRQYAPGVSFMIPARVIRAWAKQHNLEFAL
jgi:S1-C subfamily serine protease